MSFLVKNYGGTAVQLRDDYIDITIGAGETVDIESIYQGELWRFTFSAQSVTGGGALLTALTNGDVVRRNVADTADIAWSDVPGPLDDAIWLWHLTKQYYQALAGSTGTPDVTNVYVTTTDPRLSDDRYPTAHAASHLPTGLDPLTVGTAISVGVTNTQGSAAAFALADHQHQGVHGVKVASGTNRFGDVTLQPGTNIQITDASGTFTFDVQVGATTELMVTAGSGLYGNYYGGKATIDGVVYIITPGSTLLADNATNYVFINSAGSVTSNTTGYPSNSTPLAVVTTASGAITGVEDNRSFVNQNIVWGSSGDISTILPDATVSVGSVDEYARIDHVHAIATDVPVAIGISLVSTEGSSTSFARADHVHGMTTVSSFGGLPVAPTDGQSVWVSYGVYSGNYYYDSARGKWLSNEMFCKHWNSGTNVNTGTVNLVSNVDDTQQDNDFPNPFTCTITGMMGSQANTIASGNSTTFGLGVFDLTTGVQAQDIATVVLSSVGGRATRNMSLNTDVADFTVFSARRLKSSGTAVITRPALSVWYRIRLA